MAHLGRKIGSHHEIYGAVKFMPSSLDWNFIPGYFYRFAGRTQAGYQFESLDDSQHLAAAPALRRAVDLALRPGPDA